MADQLITPEMVRLNVSIDGDKYTVIKEIASLIAATGRADEAGLDAAFNAREEQMPTGFPGGIAIPHFRSDAVNEASLGLMRLDTPIDFGAKDGPADLVIGIAADEASGGDHMKLLAKLSRALVKPDFVAALRSAETPQEVSDLIGDVVNPPAQSAAEKEPSKVDATKATAAPSEDTQEGPVLLAITSCPTGIAHTYMAAESLEQAAEAKGIELFVEPQGSGGITPFPKTPLIGRTQSSLLLT